jgi:hypothetical protein
MRAPHALQTGPSHAKSMPAMMSAIAINRLLDLIDARKAHWRGVLTAPRRRKNLAHSRGCRGNQGNGGKSADAGRHHQLT